MNIMNQSGDGGPVGVPEDAPRNGKMYGRKNGEWRQADEDFVTKNEDGGFSGIVQVRSGTATELNGIALLADEIAVEVDAEGQPVALRVGDGQTNGGFALGGAGAGLSDSSDYIIVRPGDSIAAKYAEAKLLTPGGAALSATNRAALIIMPGNYPTATTTTFDANFVDVLGLGSSEKTPAVIIRCAANPAVSVPDTVTDAKFLGIYTYDRIFSVAGKDWPNPDARVFTNCRGHINSFGSGPGSFASSTYINCVGYLRSFGGDGGTAIGRFINCEGGEGSFGGPRSTPSFVAGTTSGYATFYRCAGGTNSFGGGGGTCHGDFTECVGGDYSFGGGGGSASGKFLRCRGQWGSFGGGGGIMSGTCLYCESSGDSFGGDTGTLDGTILFCVMEGNPPGTFGGDAAIALSTRDRIPV